MAFGNVKVLITYNETEEIVPIYNKTNKKSTTNETDSSGGTRITEEEDASQEVAFESERAITSKKVSPKIEGAIITATGARKGRNKNKYNSSGRSGNGTCNT